MVWSYTVLALQGLTPKLFSVLNNLQFITFSAPAQPRYFNTSSSFTSIELQWLQPNGGNSVDSFTVMWRTGRGWREFSPILFQSHVMKYFHTIDDLRPGQTYMLQVFTVNSAGRSRPALSNNTVRKYTFLDKMLVLSIA